MKSKLFFIAIITSFLLVAALVGFQIFRELASLGGTADSPISKLPVSTAGSAGQAKPDESPVWTTVGMMCAETAVPTLPIIDGYQPALAPTRDLALKPVRLPLQPENDTVTIGDVILDGDETRMEENYPSLERIDQWGWGGILGSAFSPDGRYFVVGSDFGVAVYDREAPANPPQWLPLDNSFNYDSLFFDEGGDLILLEGRHGSQVITFPDGERRPASWGGEWLRWTKQDQSWGSISVVAPDGSKRLVSHAEYIASGIMEQSVRQVVDPDDGEVLYHLGDGTFYVEYDDWNEPEGCDLYSFSMCGNAYDPSAMHPYRAGFSPDGRYLAVLYRAPNLWSSERFSVLRLYDGENGRLLNVIGSFEQPVATFAFSPDETTLLVGFQSGVVQLWDTAEGRDIFGAWHFNAPLLDVAFSPGGTYLILQRPGRVEIRLNSTGALLGRYPANAFALSPTGEYIALGDDEGMLTLKEMDSRRNLYRFQAHDGPIFALAYSPDGQTIVSSGQDCAVNSWQAGTGEFSHMLAENETDAYDFGSTASRIFIHFLKFLPGGQQIIGYGSWSRVVNWDAASGDTRYLIEPEPKEYYQGMITLNPHFPEFMSVDVDEGRFYIENAGYDIATGQSVGVFRPSDKLPTGCSMSGPLSADGRVRFTIGYDDREGQICLLNAADDSLVRTIEVFSDERTSGYITWLYLSPGGDRLMVATDSGAVLVYGIGGGEEGE
jgi:WD40 repeat protein